MKALVTGGAGFIGSHLCEHLLSKQYQVVCVDNLSTGDVRNISGMLPSGNFRFIFGTVLDRLLMDNLVKDCDCVYHLAAEVGVQKAVSCPIDTVEANIDGTRTVLDAARKYGKGMLLTSTSEVYGKNGAVPFREDDQFVLGPITTERWGYAYSKIIDEFLTLAYGKRCRLPMVVVRLFNTIGERQIGDYGMVVPRFVRAALDNSHITVYGSGEQTRCFAYVGDVVEMMTDLMECGSAKGQVFNLGSDSAISINELARKVKELIGSKSEITHITYEEAYGVHFEDIGARVPCLDKVKKYIEYRSGTDLDSAIFKIAEHLKGGREWE